MPNLAERLFAKTVSSSSSSHPTQWSPGSSLPSGFSELKNEYQLASQGRGIGKVTNVRFESVKGTWCVGTLIVTRASATSTTDLQPTQSLPPEYSRDYDQGMIKHDNGDAKTQGYAKLIVVQRFNKRELADGTKVSCVGDEFNSVVRIDTSDSAPLAASISYHVTLVLPATTTALNGFHVEADRFKVIFDPSLNQSLAIAELSIKTGDAAVSVELTGCGTVNIRNENRLNPTRTSLKHHDDLVSGSLSAESIELTCSNGPVSGDFQTTVGKLSVVTTNSNIAGTYKAAGDLVVSTTNAALHGTFVSHGKSGISIDLLHSKVDNANFQAPFGAIRLTNKLAPVAGKFTVAKQLVIKTTAFPVDAEIELSAVRMRSSSSGNGLSRSSSRHRRASSVAGVPPPSFTSDSSTTELPTFDDVMHEDSSTCQRVRVHIETTDGHVNVKYLNHPKRIQLNSSASTSGGAKVFVQHPAPAVDRQGRTRMRSTSNSNDPNQEGAESDEQDDDDDPTMSRGFVGSFRALTGGISSSATVNASMGSQLIEYTTSKRSEVTGCIPNGLQSYDRSASNNGMLDSGTATPRNASSSRPQSSGGMARAFGFGSHSNATSTTDQTPSSPHRNILGRHSRPTSRGRIDEGEPLEQDESANDVTRDIDQMTLNGDRQSRPESVYNGINPTSKIQEPCSFTFAASSSGVAEILFV
ncbi:hypothetical protein OIO90_002882 [Microbotryomycetes sp. JL221]|nr:hypothetical protein OIO90_002882 [Microbotryomycetes sp. JL221]